MLAAVGSRPPIATGVVVGAGVAVGGVTTGTAVAGATVAVLVAAGTSAGCPESWRSPRRAPPMKKLPATSNATTTIGNTTKSHTGARVAPLGVARAGSGAVLAVAGATITALFGRAAGEGAAGAARGGIGTVGCSSGALVPASVISTSSRRGRTRGVSSPAPMTIGVVPLSLASPAAAPS